MKKTEDPYKALVKLTQQTAKNVAIQPGAAVGEIVEPPPNIKVRYNGMILDKQFLYLNEYWLVDHARTAKGHLVSATQNKEGGSGMAQYESHNHDIDNDYTDTIVYTDTWKKGDKVAMMPILSSDSQNTAQQFMILCKLVRLDGN